MPSKSAKTRKHTRKRVHKELSARRTEASRKRRLDNKAKRNAILDIDSDAKVKIIDQNTYIDGDKVEVVDGKIVPSALPEGAIKTECDYEGKVEEIIDIGDDLSDFDDAVTEYQEVMDQEEPDCKLPAEKKSWKQVLKEWSNG